MRLPKLHHLLPPRVTSGGPCGRSRPAWLQGRAVGTFAAWLLAGAAWAATPMPAEVPGASGNDAGSVQAWLSRLHDGNRRHSYVGTFVVSSGVSMSSARIWHVCEGDQQVERVETLSGTPRSIFRHNDQVLTFWPETGLARLEKRESLGLFPNLLTSADGSLAEHYSVKATGQLNRVAGVTAELVHLEPRDKLRFGYRVWAEQQSGLVVKLQTLDALGQVLEQSAFSELQLGAPVKKDQLLRMMHQQGYRLEKVEPVKTTLAAEGWTLKQGVPGFKSMGCHKRPAHAVATTGLHCVFSDGLASVSVFLEPVPSKANAADAALAMGATHTLRTQVHHHAATLMGEVPPATLRLFASALERRKTSP